MVVGAWAFGGLGVRRSAPGRRRSSPSSGWAAAGAGPCRRRSAPGGEPETLRLAGTLHLLLLMALPVALLLPWLEPGFRVVVVVGFLAPLAALGWLPDLVRWVRRCR